MSYAEKYVKSRGYDCFIQRSPLFHTKVSIKRSTSASRDLGMRASYWEGIIPLESMLLSGEIITISDKLWAGDYLVQNTNYDTQSDQIAFFSAKCNVVMQHKRLVEVADPVELTLIESWETINMDISCYGEVINQKMRQETPGLLEGTIYVFQVPKVLGVALLDRISYNDKNYQVISVDEIGLDGVMQVQLSKDNRP